jgi:peroxiredoxin family protein
MAKEPSNRLAVIASHGTMDLAYPPLILSTAAIAMDMDAAIFFTFFGLNILKKGYIDKLQITLDIQLPAAFPEKYQVAVIQAAELCKVKNTLSTRR